MSLPYGPIMRGLAVSWCYDRVEEGLTALENPFQAMVFAQGSRVVGRERLDPRAVTLSQGPTAVLHVSSIALANAKGYGGPEVIYRNGDGSIVHTGTGTEEVSLTGTHSGNNSYVIEITESGEVGSGGKYELRKTPWTGSAWGTEEVVSSGPIPTEDGKIDVGNGSTFSFTLDEEVVAGDTYAWETEAYKVTNQQIRNATVSISAHIYAQNEEEVIGSGGYFDQLMLMFHRKTLAAELYDGHYETVTEEMTGMSVAPEIDGEQTTYRITVSLHYEGKVFMAEVSPLITRMEYDEPDIP
ncbi:MAG: hypothetical protein E3J71_02300 [Candidatus Stahlbacteria bacterium]|nr:MAG: hypothetical protein E3J71_02300 [Candidatus Stahlbacteria bacterium]